MQFPILSDPNKKAQITATIGEAFDAHDVADTEMVIYQPVELLLKIGMKWKRLHGPEISIG